MEVEDSTINRWVLKYAPELELRTRSHLQPRNDSWRVEQTYVIVLGVWKYLYRSSVGKTRLLSALVRSQTPSSAERFFRKVLKARHTQSPRLIKVDKNAAYPKAIETRERR